MQQINSTVTFEINIASVLYSFHSLQEHIVLMDQFVLLEGPAVQRDVLKYAVVDHGVLSVMITGTIEMLQLCVDS